MPGDLNLKKAWHPTTLTNLKKVFLAEEAQKEEEKKIKELEKAREIERGSLKNSKASGNSGCVNNSQRLDWLYRDNLAQEPSAHPIKPSSTNSTPKFSDKQKLLNKCDLWNKKNEDPLSR
jgi:hypothetical protein